MVVLPTCVDLSNEASKLLTVGDCRLHVCTLNWHSTYCRESTQSMFVNVIGISNILSCVYGGERGRERSRGARKDRGGGRETGREGGQSSKQLRSYF